MTSLYARAWKTFAHFLIKLFCTFLSYLRSFSFRSSPFPQTTPKPRVDKRSETDLECGKTPCNPRSNGSPLFCFVGTSNVPFSASPATPRTPTPCFRRPRASTLCAYTPPKAKSTPQRSLTSALSSTARNPTYTSDNVIVTGIAATFPCVLFQEMIGNSQQSVIKPERDGKPLTAKITDKEKLIASHRGSKYVKSNAGIQLQVPNPLPFKCLSPMKTLSLGIASSNGLYLRDHKRVSSLAALPRLEPSESGLGIALSRQKSEYLGRSCSLDQGLSLFQGPLISDSQDMAFTRRPRSAIQAYELRTERSPFNDHITATLVLGHCDGLAIHSKNALLNRQEEATWRRGTTGLHDVSFVKRVFSVMRADNVEQDGQDARNIFNRESVWDYRKSTVPRVKPYYSKLVAGKYDENDVFVTPTRKNRSSRHVAALSAVFRGAQRNQEMAKPAPKKRARHRSVMYELSPSPSIQRQLKVERIKRQRKHHQDMTSRVVSNQLLSSNQKARDSYDWFAQDEAILVTN